MTMAMIQSTKKLLHVAFQLAMAYKNIDVLGIFLQKNSVEGTHSHFPILMPDTCTKISTPCKTDLE